MHPTCPGFADIAKQYQNSYRPQSKPSCHCMTGGNRSIKPDDGNFFKQDISLGLIDIYGRPLKGNYSEFGQFQPKELHDFQYASLNKNPSYFLDLSQNIGLRPVVRASDIEAPPVFRYTGAKFMRETDCNQPSWKTTCI
jgi:hypothetical protein